MSVLIGVIMARPKIYKDGIRISIFKTTEVVVILLSLVLSLFSFNISQAAYKRSIREPEFEILYYVSDSLREPAKLTTENKVIVPIEFDSANDYDMEIMNYTKIRSSSEIVTPYVPGSYLVFAITNIGKVSAKYPTVFLRFEGIRLSENVVRQLEVLFPNVKKQAHVHGGGYYSQYQWISGENEILYPGIPMILDPLVFSGCEIEPGALIEVTVSSEGAEALNYTIPVIVSDLYGKQN
jgi:hypothetical protein